MPHPPARTLRIIGVGAGDPAWVTVEAVEAIRSLEVVLVLDKGAAAADLTAARHDLLARYGDPASPARVVTIDDPPRDRRPAGEATYVGQVDRWREARERLIEDALLSELGDGEVAGVLVWGDPSLYDGTLRIVDAINARGRVRVDAPVVPGVSALHALTARHRVLLNRVAGSVLVTTGRRLSQGFPPDVDDVVVMLDSHLVCRELRHEDLEIYWGAYLGTPDELLVSGRLDEVVDEIARVRAEARERLGWVMDTYLLRRPLPS